MLAQLYTAQTVDKLWHPAPVSIAAAAALIPRRAYDVTPVLKAKKDRSKKELFNMVEGSDLRDLLSTGTWTTQRAKSPRP